jgi:two-component system chemotaxis response regulator CheY
LEVYNSLDLTKLNLLVSRIREHVDTWKLINISFEETPPDAAFATRKIEAFFGAVDGAIFVTNSREFVVLVELGKAPNLALIRAGMTSQFPGYKCTVSASDVTRNGLTTLHVQLSGGPAREAPVMAGAGEKHFLVVDDDLFIRRTLKHILLGFGQVTDFADSNGVLESYKKEKYDLVFLDLHLPGDSGIDTLKAIMQHDKNANVVIISADSTAENVMNAHAQGSKGFLGKPFNKEKVGALIKKLT